MNYGPNGIKPQRKRCYGANVIYPMVYSPNGKDMVLRKTLYRGNDKNVMAKKIQYKRHNVSKN